VEIEIDSDLVRDILARERDQARRELTTLGPLRALEASQHRHDERLAAAPDASTLACRAGCYWCCYFTVDVRPVEVFRILDFMEHEMQPLERERARDEIARNSAMLRNLSPEERVHRNIKCSFLNEGRCTIYAARPQTCRNYHATNVDGCKQSFDEPDNKDIDPEFAPLVYQSGGAHVEGFSAATHEAGLDTDAYELNTALAAAMVEPESRLRFLRSERPFPDLEGLEVPPEFGDDDQPPQCTSR
jgi:Fe-S-cluster containining protein